MSWRAGTVIVLALAGWMTPGFADARIFADASGDVISTGPLSPDAYPDSEYVKGTGAFNQSQGVTADQALSAARDAARGEVARFFSVTVDSSFSSLVNHVCMKSDSGPACSEKASVQDLTRTRTSVVLEGVEIVATWREGSTWYATAVLNRKKAGQAFVAEIDALDSQIRTLIEPGGDVPPIVRVRNVRRAMTLQVSRQIQAGKAALVGAVPPASTVSDSGLLGLYRDALAAMPVEIRVSGEGSDDIARAVKSGLAEKGLVTVDSVGSGAVVLELRWTLTPIPGTSQGFVFATWNLDVALFDAASDAMADSIGRNSMYFDSVSGREGHSHMAGANRRCVVAAVSACGPGSRLIDGVVAAILVDPGVEP